MTRQKLAWFMAVAVLTLLVVASAPAFPWQQAEGSAAKSDAGQAAEDETQPDDSTVESILRQNEQLEAGQRFSYDPAGRRDPFQNIWQTQRLGPGGKRPKGVQGMVVAEIDLVGIVKKQDQDIAMVIGSDNKGYFLQVGDTVFDGTVISVDAEKGAIRFRQQIDDPRMIKPYRDIEKRLVTDENEGEVE